MRCQRTLLAAASAAIVLAGCGSSATVKHAAGAEQNPSMPGMGTSGVSGSGGSSSTKLTEAGVAAPIPTRTIANGVWKDMRITAQERTPVPFMVDNGTSFSEVKPTKKTSFHLMVMLTDRHTGVAIPYANVWAQISEHGKTVFNERQWPMLSEYMGPHYGNDITLPGPGHYTLTLLVTAPEAAMHMEYAHMWSGTDKVTSSFTWQ